RAVPSGIDPVRRLQRALRGVTSRYDLVLVDCPPSLGELTRNALFSATQAVIVTEPSYFAVQGAEQAVEAVQVAVREGNPRLSVVAIVPNRTRAVLSEHRFRLDELRSVFGVKVTEPIPERTAIQQAQGAGVPIHAWKSAGARSAAKTFDDLLGRVADVSSRDIADELAREGQGSTRRHGPHSARPPMRTCIPSRRPPLPRPLRHGPNCGRWWVSAGGPPTPSSRAHRRRPSATRSRSRCRRRC